MDYAYQPVATQSGTGGAPYMEDEATAGHGAGRSQLQGYSNILCTTLNILLVFVPLGVLAGQLEWSAASRFFLNFMAIVPLAGILGAATESLAVHTGEMVGGLLNATFGNAVEMIVTINAIRSGLVNVVQGSLLGSILSNLLLVLGMAFFAAGLYTKECTFNRTGASANTTCLVLAAISMALPTIFNHVPNTSQEDVLAVSRISSLVIAFNYVLFLYFQLGTHAYLFVTEGEEEEEAELNVCNSIILLVVCTICVAINSEILVDAIEGVTLEYGIPEAFIGVILLPIVGNAAEHTTAVTSAIKGKMDLCLGVAVGSSSQIALFVVPFSVMIGWVYDQPMTLDFRSFDTAVLVLSVFIAHTVLTDGCTNWLEGAMLVATYTVIAATCWYIPDNCKVEE